MNLMSVNAHRLIPVLGAAAYLMISGTTVWGRSFPGQAPQSSIARALGTITALQGNAVTLKTDAGAEVRAEIQESARLVRIEPGQKDLKNATPVQLQDLQVGDRVLVRGSNSADGKSLLAMSVILMKKSDIQQKQQQEEEDWQKRGAGGLVKAVDPAAGTVTISARSGATTRTITINVAKDTIIRRYSSDSVRFNDAKPSTLDQIKPGDQLRARGQRSSDGELTAEEIVSGSFRNIAGTVVSVDASSNELSVKDLATKKTVVVKVTLDSQMRKLPQAMAQMIAARLKGSGSVNGAAGAGAAGGGRPGQGEGRESTSPPATSASSPPAGQRRFGEGSGGPEGRAGGGTADFQQLLNRLPPSTLADLQKGDAVMIVSTEGGASEAVTAITLLSGVEPILTAPAESRTSLLSGWGLGGGGGEAAGGDSGGGTQ